MIGTGHTIDPSDFVNDSSRDATTPTNDAARVAKFEGDGRIDPFFTRIGRRLTSGEAITGASLPAPVYIDTTAGTVFKCQANNAAKLDFRGFATNTTTTSGQAQRVQMAGVVAGFSALTIGAIYYVQDTAGALGTTPGTNTIPVGVAISATELLIQKRRISRIGTGTQASAATVTVTHNLGIVPEEILFDGTLRTGNTGGPDGHSTGVYSVPEGTYATLGIITKDTVTSGGGNTNPSTSKFSTYPAATLSGQPSGSDVTIQNVTATTFDLIFASPGGGFSPTYYTWRAYAHQR